MCINLYAANEAEYGMGNKVSVQGGAYSYGILLEMFVVKRPTDEMFKVAFTYW